MAFSDTSPNFSSVARLAIMSIQDVNRGYTNPLTITSLLNNYGPGFLGTQQTYKTAGFPVWWRYAFSADTLLVWLTGSQGITGPRELVRSMLDPGQPMNTIADNPQCFAWAQTIFVELWLTQNIRKPKISIMGFSLGGAIGLSLGMRFSQQTDAPQVFVSSFGAPATWGFGQSPPNSMWYARWTIPTDNVPSLPPGPEEAPELYAQLRVAQRDNLSKWKHPQRAYQVSAGGVATLVHSPSSIPITMRTLLAVVNSPAGILGIGHDLSQYLDNIQAMSNVGQNPVVPPTPPPPSGSVPPLSQVPLALSPPNPPPTVNNTQLDQRRVAFSASATLNDNAAFVVDDVYRCKANKQAGGWVITWCDYEIALAPTKKKARACCRHLNEFLKVFQGVGEADVHAFVLALAFYLNVAATPGLGFAPVLNNGGNFIMGALFDD